MTLFNYLLNSKQISATKMPRSIMPNTIWSNKKQRVFADMTPVPELCMADLSEYSSTFAFGDKKKCNWKESMFTMCRNMSVGQLVYMSFETISVPENPSTKWTKKEIELSEKLQDLLKIFYTSENSRLNMLLRCECCFCELLFWELKFRAKNFSGIFRSISTFVFIDDF